MHLWNLAFTFRMKNVLAQKAKVKEIIVTANRADLTSFTLACARSYGLCGIRCYEMLAQEVDN